MRTGLGFDAHRFADGRRLVLGGVEIAHPRGLAGHSDADVAVHAVMDALLGAVAAGDIGEHFPDTDSEYRDIASLALLALVREKVEERGYRVVNIDLVVVCEEPRIAPYREEMRANLARACGIEVGAVSVKGTTTEGMGFTGAGEGIAAMAVALLEEAQ